MNAYEYLQALRAALAVLPDDEIDSAMRYYEDYFLDAGDENAAQVIEQLGPPEQVAEAILRDYTGVARRRPERFEEEKAQTVDGVPLGRDGKPLTRKKGINPWMLACIVLLALIFGPVAVAVIGAIIVAVVGLVIGIAACVVAVPAATLIGGGALVLFSFLLWATPASALATLAPAWSSARSVCCSCCWSSSCASSSSRPSSADWSPSFAGRSKKSVTV